MTQWINTESNAMVFIANHTYIMYTTLKNII